jgi:hypothetical protein
MFAFFSNRLGCLGSIVVSVIGTLIYPPHLNDVFDKIFGEDGCSLESSGSAARSGRAGNCRFHVPNFSVASAPISATTAGVRLLGCRFLSLSLVG